MTIVNFDNESGDAMLGIGTSDEHDLTEEEREIDEEEKAEETRRKAKARKSGPSLLSKTKQLGHGADVFALAIYFDPTHKTYQIQICNPEGAEVPDVNRMIKEKLLANAEQEEITPRPYTRSYAEKSVRKSSGRPSRKPGRPSRKPGRPSRKRGRPSRNLDQQANREETVDEVSVDDGSESDTANSKNRTPSPPVTVQPVAKQQESNKELEQSGSPYHLRVSDVAGFSDEERAWETLDIGDYPSITEGEDALSWFQPDLNISEEGRSPLSGESLCSGSSSQPTLLPKMKPSHARKGRSIDPNVYQRLLKITEYPVMRADNSASIHRPQQHRRRLPDRPIPGYRSRRLDIFTEIIRRNR